MGTIGLLSAPDGITTSVMELGGPHVQFDAFDQSVPTVPVQLELRTVTGKLTAVPTQPGLLVSVTLTLPAPLPPQSAVMLLVVVPPDCVPPEIDHAYELPSVFTTE